MRPPHLAPMMANGQPLLFAGLFTTQDLVDPVESLEAVGSRLDFTSLIKVIISICDSCPFFEDQPQRLGNVARLWLGNLIEGQPLTIPQLASEVHVTPARARWLVDNVMAIARKAVRGDFVITNQGWRGGVWWVIATGQQFDWRTPKPRHSMKSTLFVANKESRRLTR